MFLVFWFFEKKNAIVDRKINRSGYRSYVKKKKKDIYKIKKEDWHRENLWKYQVLIGGRRFPRVLNRHYQLLRWRSLESAYTNAVSRISKWDPDSENTFTITRTLETRVWFKTSNESEWCSHTLIGWLWTSERLRERQRRKIIRQWLRLKVEDFILFVLISVIENLEAKELKKGWDEELCVVVDRRWRSEFDLLALKLTLDDGGWGPRWDEVVVLRKERWEG